MPNLCVFSLKLEFVINYWLSSSLKIYSIQVYQEGAKEKLIITFFQYPLRAASDKASGKKSQCLWSQCSKNILFLREICAAYCYLCYIKLSLCIVLRPTCSNFFGVSRFKTSLNWTPWPAALSFISKYIWRTMNWTIKTTINTPACTVTLLIFQFLGTLWSLVFTEQMFLDQTHPD